MTRSQTSRAAFTVLRELVALHTQNSVHFRNVTARLFPGALDAASLEELPYLPSEMFKTNALKSIEDGDVFKILKSSGTTGQARSHIYLDRETARSQTKALSSIFAAAFGPKRMPMLSLDNPGQLQNRASFSARGAGILGFSMFAHKRVFALNDDMSVNIEAVKAFLSADAPRKFIFGFTAIIWQEFLQKIDGFSPAACVGEAHLLHGGGWKKLAAQNISAQAFREAVTAKLPCVKTVRDYYGMVEQTGSIYMGCDAGFLHTNAHNDILCRDPDTLEIAPPGTSGVMQVLSVLPTSYPGFSILTEDLGTVHGDGGCPCGQPGKYFSIHGRLEQAEIRGCSDTYEAAA